MKFRLDNETMYVTPENRAEAKAVHEELKLFKVSEQPFEYGTWLNEHADGTREVAFKGRWVDVYVSAPPRFIEPYFANLKYWTGHGGFFDRPVELTPAWDTITPYFIPRKIWLLGNGHVDAVVYTDYHERHQKDTFEDLFKRTQEALCEYLGHRPWEREFIPVAGGGLYKHNPDYGRKRHPPKEGRGEYATSVHKGVMHAIWMHWITYYASAAQKDVLAKALHVDKPIEHPDFHDSALYVLDPKGTCNYDGKGKMVTVYRAEDFRKLQEESPCKPSTATAATTSSPPATTETQP